jgi:hypothetical protein
VQGPDEQQESGVAHPLAPYRSPAQRDAQARSLTERAAGEVHLIGHSVQGRPLLACELKSSRADAPAVLVCANIHGVEFIAAEVALAVLESASRADSMFARLRERADIWVIPSLNPDGYARTWAAGGHGALHELRRNANGVDLNRNFPKPRSTRSVWFDFNGWRTGSDNPDNPFFRGVGPASEPETAALVALHQRIDFHASANLHSTMGTVIPPCLIDRQTYRIYGDLSRAFRGGQVRWRYRRMANQWFDRFTGEQEDFQHHLHGTWAVCIEHYPLWVNPWRLLRRGAIFWRFNPMDPQIWVDNDLPGLAAYFNAALDLARPHPRECPDSARPSR